MAKLSDLLVQKAKGDVQVGDASVRFVFYVMWRDRFSEDEWTALLSATGREYLKMLLPRVVEQWDIVDDEGHTIPVTVEAIEQFRIPDVLLAAIERRVIGSELSGKAISNNSPAP